MQFRQSFFWPAVAVLICILGTVQVLSMRNESQTYDEGFELASGYSYLLSGDYRICIEHPPLARIIAALPLLALDPSVPFDDISWKTGDFVEFGHRFLYDNRLPADTILFAGRLMMVLLTLCLVLAVALWTKREFGALAGLLAAAFVAFDPNFIAHGHYVKNDAPAALFAFLACIAWGSYLQRRGRVRLLIAGLALGCALAVKFSCAFVLPVFVLLWWIFEWRESGKILPRRFPWAFATVLLISVLVMGAVYLPYSDTLLPFTRSQRVQHPEVKMLYETVNMASVFGRTVAWVSGRIGLRSHPLPEGFSIFLGHNSSGHPSYLLGKTSDTGWWYYFPVVFAVKSTTAVLLAVIILLILVFRRLPSISLRKIPFSWYVASVPLLVYLPMSMTSNVNIGVRHILPLYPFIYVLVGAGLSLGLKRYAVAIRAVIVALLLVESAAIYPHYTSFFNVLAGGPANGHKILLDSNLDWGQDLLYLKKYLEANKITKVCSCYFGSALPEYYNLPSDYVPATGDTKARAELDCVVAVSATPLFGLYMPPEDFAWLRERRPMARIGYSIYLYDFRRATSPR
jgi:4-amino-4-deoxy-L-arabinose transferase-like glycosyltransferase